MFIYELEEDLYRQDPSISQSDIKNMLVSHAYFKHCKENPKEPTPAMKMGTAFHCMILQPALFKNLYIEAPSMDGRSKEYKDFCVKNSDRIILKPEEMQNLHGMADSLMSHRYASSLFSKGRSEVSLFWSTVDNLVSCKSRFDFITEENSIVDLKTTALGNAHPDRIQKYILDYQLYIQDAFYRDAFNTVVPCSGFQFVFVEKEPPYHVAVYELDEEFIEYGRHLYQKALSEYKERMERPEYSATYHSVLQRITVPPWFKKGMQWE